jgi:hypothetical protein
MKKITLMIIATFISFGASAGCLKAAKESLLNTNIKLETEQSKILKPGEDSVAYRGEYFNTTKSNVEVFFLSESNGYYRLYSALLLDAKSCKFVAKQSLGDDA